MALREWDHIPSLRELLPRTRGIAGCEYLVCDTSEIGQAQEDEDKNGAVWRVYSSVAFFRVNGPSGHADCVLMYRGEPIQDSAQESSRREMFVSDSIRHATGHDLGAIPDHSPTAKPTKRKEMEVVNAG